MTTLRQIERDWTTQSYDRLFRATAVARPEAAAWNDAAGAMAVPATAMAVIRLEELGQSHTPLASRLVKSLLSAQNVDGGWGEPALTALCLRALCCDNGRGPSVERGMAYLASLQQEDGLWPAVGNHRMPADPHVSALVLQLLGDNPLFRAAVRFQDGIEWFERNGPRLAAATRSVWELAAVRCRRPVAATAMGTFLS